MLPDLPHQGVEGILNALGKKHALKHLPILRRDTRERRGLCSPASVSLALSSSADCRLKVQNQAGKTNKDLSVALREQD